MLPQRYLLAHFEITLDFSPVNLLAHNNISQICYCGQISLQSAAVNCSLFWLSDIFGVVIFILLVMAQETSYSDKSEMSGNNIIDENIPIKKQSTL